MPSPSTATIDSTIAAALVKKKRPTVSYRPETKPSMSTTIIRRPRMVASNPLPTRSGSALRWICRNGRNASTGNSSSIRLPARSATTRRTWSGASRPARRANSATSRATVCVPSIIRASCHSSGVSRR